MIAIKILKILTTIVLAIVAILTAENAPEQGETSDGIFFFVLALFIALGATFMWL